MGFPESTYTQRKYLVNPDFDLEYKNQPLPEVGFHHNDFYEVYFFISGKVNYMIEGKSYILKPDDILIIGNKEIHKPIVDPEFSYERVVLSINPEFISNKNISEIDLSICFDPSTRNHHNLLRLNSDMLYTIRRILYNLNSVFNSKSYGDSMLKHLYLLELLIYLNKACLEKDAQNANSNIICNEKISKVIEYINSNIFEDLSLDNISSKFYTSKYHLAREFKRHTGCTFHSFIQQKRFIHAKTLLKEGYTVASVCEKCGFNDYSNFIRAFRTNWGVTPKEYSRLSMQGRLVE